jgi:tetratricopeptide (TPR) repeat protein
MQAEFDEHLDLSFQLLNRWLESHPDDVTAMYDRRMAYYLRDDPDLERQYERIIEKAPTYVAYINLGRDYSKLGRHAEAQQVLTQAISLAERRMTNSGMAWLQLAIAKEAAGDNEGAREAYLEANERLPQVYWPHLYYAKYLEKQNELGEAMRGYERMVKQPRTKPRPTWTAGDFARQVHRLRSRGFLPTGPMQRQTRL